MRIPKRFIKQATPLAARPYNTIIVYEDEFYFATDPDLKGCKAQGYSYEEALENIKTARVDYIAALLMDGLEVPSPKNEISWIGYIG